MNGIRIHFLPGLLSWRQKRIVSRQLNQKKLVQLSTAVWLTWLPWRRSVTPSSIWVVKQLLRIKQFLAVTILSCSWLKHHTSDIRVHTNGIRVTYEYSTTDIRVHRNTRPKNHTCVCAENVRGPCFEMRVFACMPVNCEGGCAMNTLHIHCIAPSINLVQKRFHARG